MKRIAEALLATVALVLIAADRPSTSHQVPRDDPADVKMVQQILRGPHVRLDGDGNVSEIYFDANDLRGSELLQPALRRLRHVRRLGTSSGVDQVVEAAKPWTTLEDVSLGTDVTDKGLASLEGMWKLRRLSIDYGRQVTDAGVKSIGRLKNLEVLWIENAQITDACMKDIAGLPRLKELNLQGNRITDRGLADLKGMKLEELNLRSSKITDRGLGHVKDMTTLKLLEVFDTKVTEAGCTALRESVPDLKVWGALEKEVKEEPDDPKDVAALEAAFGTVFRKDNVTDNIHQLTLRGRSAFHTTDEQRPQSYMKHLKGLHNLISLNFDQAGIGDDDLAHLVGLRKLQYLSVGGGTFSDAGLKHIEKLTSLRLLNLSVCPNITSAGMKYLGRLERLEALSFAGTAIDDEALAHLSKLKNLRGLDLLETKVTDAGLANLAPLVNMEHLSLYGTQTTDAGLVHLYAMKKLGVFSPGTGMTREGLKDLQKHVPRLYIPEPNAPAGGR